MKKTDWQYLVDTLLFLSIVGIASIGFLLGLVLPKGPSVPESSKYFFGLHRHQWGNLHFYLSIAFVVLVLIHLIFSWKWIGNKSRQLFKKRRNAALISTALASVFLVVLLWALYPKYPGVYEEYEAGGVEMTKSENLSRMGYAAHREDVFFENRDVYVVLTGQTSLVQAEKATGIPARTIASALELPSHVSLDETFGQLRKKYGLNLLQVRDVITDLLGGAAEPDEEKTGIAGQEGLPEADHEQKIARGISAEDQSGILITGRMTLYEIGTKTGIPPQRLVGALNLPSDASFDETLGRMRRRYGFTIQDVRDAIVSLMDEKGKKN